EPEGRREPAAGGPVAPGPVAPSPVAPSPVAPIRAVPTPPPASKEPPAAASPASPAQPARKIDDPFSVEEIEAEFARLLGRPISGSGDKT
ncbi:MAG TPA: hypothetical protein VFS03_02530, partial [Microvirga sp.]|nr:hypothetical protein [Microvirga sp.]